MGIFRGLGGTGESSSDSTINAISTTVSAAAASASSASTSASSASTSATAAASSASAASSSASTASTSASNASTSATNAASSASAASTSASNASTSATNAAASAALAATYTGTVTSVTGTSPVSVATGTTTPVISLATNYGDTQNPYASKTANYILASPNGSSGAPTFRALVAADIPIAAASIVTYTGSETLTNKTLTNPSVNNYTEGVVAIGTVTTTNTISLTSGTVQTATLTASTACTFTMPTATAGKSFVLLLKQAAATGNGTATFTSVKWGTSGAPTITATAGKMDILTFIADGTNWYGSAAQGYTP